jgi:hypothetical protein
MSDYPREDQLQRVREWPHDDMRGWLAYIKSIGNYWPESDPWGWTEEDTLNAAGRPTRRYHISTGGWSGNEDIISAMQDNAMLWTLYWQSSQRGGHHTFEVPHA